MKDELQFKLSAYLDGELPDGEAREMTDWLTRDTAARALLAELKNTNGAMAGFEAEIKLPESREFYWSKIEREITRQEKAETAKAPGAIFLSLRRLLIPTAAVAAVVIAVSLISPQLGGLRMGGDPEMETAFADADTVTYRDYVGGTTLIWLSYPAENEFAETEPADILN